MEAKDVYLSDFERFEKEPPRGEPGFVRRLRQGAMARFDQLGFPGPRDEEWRFTPVAPLARVPFELAPADDGLSFRVEGPELPEGVLLTTLAEALANYPQLVEPHLARYADFKSHPFVALNTAFLRDGLFVHVPRGRVVEGTIYLEHRTPAGDRPLVRHRRALVVLEENSRAAVVESYRGGAGTYFTNGVTEIVLAPGARLDHYKVQEEGAEAFHVHTTQTRLDRGSVLRSLAVTLGGGWVRNEVNAAFTDEDAEATLNGLYLGDDDQLLANYTRIDHAKPRCTSHELYKGILGGKARGVFNGKIYVHPDAQKTDAKQTNQTLLLSEDAVIDTKPQLEIFADDVKCTHGATVGQLDEQQVFYLRSRGVGEAQARALLTYAFANDIVRRIQVEPVRARLEDVLLARQHLPRETEVTEAP
ncbi:MAG TPA: Fe-S cluster assembly protein SufD [Gemmataceae bacterium]|nr:Fe-S cluster assembly protein SufD [Gemmataceae bacterium]